MSDFAFLQDEEWMSDREKKWDKYVARWLYDSPKEEVEFRRKYFFEGDVKYLLTDSFEVTLYNVINCSPFDDTNLLVECISEYWFWVLESPSNRDYHEMVPDLNDRFMASMHAIFSYKDDNLNPDVCVGLFFWLYGDVYKGDRALRLSYDEKTTTIPISIDIDKLCFDLLDGIIKYLWYRDEGENIYIFKAFIPYFLSIYSKMSPICFGLTLPEEEFETSNGKKYYRKYWIWNRWLLTTLNGFISEYEEEEDIEELISNDKVTLSNLKEGLSNLEMPDEFYILEEFVFRLKGESLYASEK